MEIHQLLPQELRARFPQIGATAEQENPLVLAKFFFPDFHWTWYAIEFDGIDTFYGYVDGDFPELGSFSLRELLETRGAYGCTVERDLYFQDTPLQVIQQKAEARIFG